MKIVSSEEYQNILTQAKPHLDRLLEIIHSVGETLEGNCFYKHCTTEPIENLEAKQRNLFTLGRHSKKVLEIGFNAGHSALLFLLSDPNLTIDCIDICIHKYTEPCFEYLNQQFGNRVKLYKGDGNICLEYLLGLTPVPQYDVFHIDGSHNVHSAHLNFLFCKKLARSDDIVVFDDTDIPSLGNLWKFYIETCGVVDPFELLTTTVYPHGLGKFIK